MSFCCFWPQATSKQLRKQSSIITVLCWFLVSLVCFEISTNCCLLALATGQTRARHSFWAMQKEAGAAAASERLRVFQRSVECAPHVPRPQTMFSCTCRVDYPNLNQSRLASHSTIQVPQIPRFGYVPVRPPVSRFTVNKKAPLLCVSFHLTRKPNYCPSQITRYRPNFAAAARAVRTRPALPPRHGPLRSHARRGSSSAQGEEARQGNHALKTIGHVPPEEDRPEQSDKNAMGH